MTVEEVLKHVEVTDRACVRFLEKYASVDDKEIEQRAIDPILSLLSKIASIGHEECDHVKVLPLLNRLRGGHGANRRFLVGVTQLGDVTGLEVNSQIPVEVVLRMPILPKRLTLDELCEQGVGAKDIVAGARAALFEVLVEGMATQPSATA